jgi:hypothetical protein
MKNVELKIKFLILHFSFSILTIFVTSIKSRESGSFSVSPS